MTIKNINVKNYIGNKMEHPEFTLKTCLFADKDVGKKSLAKFSDQHYEEDHSLTLGVEFLYKRVDTFGLLSAVSFWMVSDREDARKLYPYYINGSNGVILMYDMTNSKSLDFLSEVLQNIKKSREKYNFPILLVGNKSDLKKNREISKEQIKKFKIENNISKSMEISTKTGENVEKMFMRTTGMSLKKVSQRQFIDLGREESILKKAKFLESLDYKIKIPIVCWIIILMLFSIFIITGIIYFS